MDMSLTIVQDKGSIRIDPRTKVFVLIAISLIMVTGDISGIGYYIGIIMSSIPLVLSLTTKNRSGAVAYAMLIAFSSILEVAVMNVTGMVNIILLFISGMISRFLPGIFMGYYIVNSTTVSEFISAMKKMNITDKIVIPLTVMFRFIPTIADENKSISMAMKMRGIGIRGSRKNPIELIEYRLIPVIMATVRIGNELSAAALTKGLDTDTKRTSICEIGFGKSDAILFAITIVGILLFSMNLGGMI